ncbi:MAG: putative zinc-binding protein [Kiritimatiellae bacterium]|nr:putative zinc-binding protein [Kiritimatiellia bacterium]MDD5519541.1 putative zinc-binding protein [Kiritimatiellia bacterium]
MVDLPERKAGIVACSGEELAEGTVTRLAALKVLHELRPNDTVTICLPLFLAGGEGDRTFARFHPTITVDGCDLKCAARATEMYSGKPAASIVVNELVKELGLVKPDGRRRLNEAGRRVVEVVADRLAGLVDKVLGKDGCPPVSDTTDVPAAKQSERQVTCSCGSGIPVTKFVIDGKPIEMLALPLIFKKFSESGRRPDANVVQEILEMAKIYNPVPVESEENYRKEILVEYTKFWNQETKL